MSTTTTTKNPALFYAATKKPEGLVRAYARGEETGDHYYAVTEPGTAEDVVKAVIRSYPIPSLEYLDGSPAEFFLLPASAPTAINPDEDKEYEDSFDGEILETVAVYDGVMLATSPDAMLVTIATTTRGEPGTALINDGFGRSDVVRIPDGVFLGDLRGIANRLGARGVTVYGWEDDGAYCTIAPYPGGKDEPEVLFSVHDVILADIPESLDGEFRAKFGSGNTASALDDFAPAEVHGWLKSKALI